MKWYNKMVWKIKRLLGFKEFKRLEEVKEELQGKNNIDDFSNGKFLNIYEKNDTKIWLVSTSKKFYFVLDNGYDIRILYTKTKKEFKYEIENNIQYGKIKIDGVSNSIPFDKALSGDTIDFKTTINNLINE